MKDKRHIDFIVAAKDITKFRIDREELNTEQFIADPEKFDLGKLLGESMADLITVLRIGGRPEIDEVDHPEFKATLRLPPSLTILTQNYLNAIVITIAENIVDTTSNDIPREIAFAAAVDFLYKMTAGVIEYNGFSDDIKAKVNELAVINFADEAEADVGIELPRDSGEIH